MVFAARTAGDAKPAYEAVVVGSGYGGGVAASRLARMGLRVCLLEQGRLWRPGDFPTTIRARCRTTRLTGRVPDIGAATGLYYLSVGRGLTVFGASGLGGGSLINAGVVLRPDLDRLRRAGWPEPVVGDGLLLEGMARAETMLGVAPAPAPDRFAKHAGMHKAAGAAGRPLRLPSMTISHAPGRNVSGVLQYACRYCGDCWSGCNVGAKNTVGITYVVDAVDHGAEVFCESRAQSIARTAGGWEVVVEDLSRPGAQRRIAASILVLAAGTLGTNELLLRAQQQGLPLSQRLGRGFSANGDDLVFASNLETPVNAVATGFPPQAPRGAAPVGPHSMALIDLGDEHGPLWVHDGTMLTLMAALSPLESLFRLRLGEAWRLLRQGRHGDELSRSQLLYIVAHDDASGRLLLQRNRVIVDWPGYSGAPERLRAERKVRALIEGIGGVFNPNPFTMKAFGGNRIIAHPLGGCAMADTAETGVVAHDGRVFDPSKGPAGVHDGLYVCDGAVAPSAVGVSPLLAITALAERAMILAARRLGRPLDVATAPPRPERDAAM
ncbi:MAG: GMC oxidoreductase [Hyphomicrobiaceae bacterium]|nr:GMC oxidoreductase [Hyphomicrobiaceae bacterium]